jgi:hypothetical protein
MTRRKKEEFDCVELQHRGGALLAERLKGMTREEQIAYFAEGTREMRRQQAERRRSPGTDDEPSAA